MFGNEFPNSFGSKNGKDVRSAKTVFAWFFLVWNLGGGLLTPGLQDQTWAAPAGFPVFVGPNLRPNSSSARSGQVSRAARNLVLLSQRPDMGSGCCVGPSFQSCLRFQEEVLVCVSRPCESEH